MILPLPLRLAGRELRGGLRGFRIFLACLALGVAAIAAVGTVRSAMSEGLSREGARLLGGDAEMTFTYRFARPDERAFMTNISSRVSETVEFRSLATVGEAAGADRDQGGRRRLSAARHRDARPADAARRGPGGRRRGDGAGAGRPARPRAGRQLPPRDQGLHPLGDPRSLSRQCRGRLRPRAAHHPQDRRAGRVGPAGPKARCSTPPTGSTCRTAPTSTHSRHEAETEAPGVRWRDARRGAAGTERFVDRLGSFLILIGLSGLAVGGVGVASAVRAYLAGKTETIAILRTLGASRSTIFLVYFSQIGASGGCSGSSSASSSAPACRWRSRR